MTTHEHETALARALRQVPREVQPERDLWPGIAHALHASAPRTLRHPLALAACLILALGLGLHFSKRQFDALMLNPVALAYLDTLLQEHESSKQAMLVRFQDQEAYYPGWNQQMRQLEQAEQVIYQALKADPRNLELVRILRQVQTRQLQLIDAVFDSRVSSI